MTNATPRTTSSSGPFAPRALVPVNTGRGTVNLYPVIDQTMATHERAHAFHINKTALSSQNIDLRVQLDALGHQLNLSATVDGVINDWLRYFYDRWCDFTLLRILSFHNTKGDEVNDTTEAGDSSILLPVIDGNYATCRKNVKFVRVQISVNFIDLVVIDDPGPTTLRMEYFIELPQSTVQMANGAGNAYNLTTFHGTADLRTLSSREIQAQILDLTLQDGPVELQAASFGATGARTDSFAIKTDIQEKILRLASASICQTMFTELCPGYSNQPHAALDHIRQVHNDRDGNPVSSSVQAYYQQLMSASRPFSSQREYPVSVCARFIDGLDPRLLTGFRRNFPHHSIVHSLNAAHQRKVLQEMLQAAQIAEDDFLLITRVSREAVGLSQAFLGNSPAGGGQVNPVVGAYPSQAELTMQRYATGSGQSTNGSATTPTGDRRGRRFFACHGCGGPHPWTEFKNGEHIVICPNRDNPGVRENAKKNIDKMKANRQKRHSQNTKRKNLGTANFADFDPASQDRIQEQVLLTMRGAGREISDATSVASSITTPSSVVPSGGGGRGGGPGRGSPAGRGGGRIFIVDVPVLAAGPALKPMMPIAIHSNLPHIVMQFGPNLDSPNSPSIRCAVDSCAALSTGNFHYFASLAKRFPHCVAKVFAPQDYAPIVLSGVVQSHQHEAVTTELEVGFQFHLPYKTSDGEEASLLIATGPHVSVNTILGLPFMQGTGMILDLVDNLAECKYLDCPPFPIDFRRTSNHVPVTDEPGATVQIAESAKIIIDEIMHLERYYEAKVQAGSLSGKPTAPAVRFGTQSAAGAALIDSDSVHSATRTTGILVHRWVPPTSVHEDDDDYNSVLREDGYL